MNIADVKLVKIKMFLLEAEEKASEIYAPILAELWRIIREPEETDEHAAGPRANGKDV